MREISPAHGVSADEYLRRFAPPEAQILVAEIRRQKQATVRPLPSSRLIDRSNLLIPEQRPLLLDRVATLVDENLVGRSEPLPSVRDVTEPNPSAWW